MARIRLRDLNPAVFLHSVGIGVESPSVKLDVDGAGKFSGRLDVNHDTIKLYNSENTNNTYFFVENTSTGNAGLKLKNSQGEFTIIANDRLRFISEDSPSVEVMALHPNGNVGIGTGSSTADDILHVNKSGGGVLRLTDSAASSDGDKIASIQAAVGTGTFFAGINFYRHDADDGEIRLRQKVAGTNTDVMTLVDGKVGIGTAPSYNGLHIKPSSGDGQLVVEKASAASASIYAQSSLVKIGTISDHPLELMANSTSHVSITTDGKVSIGEGKLELGSTTVTATGTELNYVDGVTSAIQTQLDGKQPLDSELTELATMGSTTASALADLTQAEVQILDGATLSTTELNYVGGVTSAIQTQLDNIQTTLTFNAVSSNNSNPSTSAQIKTYVDGEISSLVASAPGALDTLNELAAAIDDDASFASTMTTALAGKQATITAGSIAFDKMENLTADKVLVSDTNGDVSASTISYSSGSIGIGTVPSQILEIKSSSQTKLLLNRDAANDVELEFKNTEQSWTAGIDRSNSNTFTIATGTSLNNATGLRVTTAGKVGIGVGVNTIDHPLTIHGDGANTYIKNLVKSNHQVGIEFNRTETPTPDPSYNTNWIQYIPSSSTDLRFYNGGDKITLTAGGALSAVGNIHSDGNLSAVGYVNAGYLRTSGGGDTYAQLNDGTLWLGDKGSTSNFGAGSYPSASWGGIDHAYDVLSFGGRSMKFWSSATASHKPAITILKEVNGSDVHTGPGRVVIGEDTLSMAGARLEVHGHINLVGGAIYYDGSATSVSTGSSTLWAEVGSNSRIYYSAGSVGIGANDPSTDFALEVAGAIGIKNAAGDHKELISRELILHENVRLKADAWINSSDDVQRIYFESGGTTFLRGHTSTGSILEVRNTEDATQLSLSDEGVLGDCSVPWSLLTGVPTYNNYVHPSYSTTNIDTSGATIVDKITTNSTGHITAMGTRTLTLANLGYTGATDANKYVHPTHTGDDFSVDTGALTGAVVVSDIDINVTTDTLGHVTDANGSVSTRTLTLADLGYTGATDANKYVHPSSAGNKHIPSGGSAGKFLKYSSDGTAVWATPSYTTNTDVNWNGTSGQSASTSGGANKIVKTTSVGRLVLSDATYVGGSDNDDAFNFTSLTLQMDGGLYIKSKGFRGSGYLNNFDLFQGDGNSNSKTKILQGNALGLHSHPRYSGTTLAKHWIAFAGPTWNSEPLGDLVFGGAIATAPMNIMSQGQIAGGLKEAGAEFNVWVTGTGTSNGPNNQDNIGIATPYILCGTVDDVNQKDVANAFGTGGNSTETSCGWLQKYQRNASTYSVVNGSCIEGSSSAGFYEFGLVCIRNAGIEGTLAIGGYNNVSIAAEKSIVIDPDNLSPDTAGLVIGNGRTSLPEATASDFPLSAAEGAIFSPDLTAAIDGYWLGLGAASTGTKLRLYVNGNVGLSGELFVTSDETLKENVDSLREGAGSSIISSLRGVTFDWKEDAKQNDPQHTSYDVAGKKARIGFVAQEVEKVCPLLVSSVDGHKSINYLAMMPILVEALKEQQEAIKALKEEVENLKNS